MRRAVLLQLLLLLAAGPPSAAQADPLDAPEVRQAVDAATLWLEDCVLDFRATGKGCNDAATETAEMVAAAGLDVRNWPSSGPSLYDRILVPDNTDAGRKRPSDPTRELYGATHTGYDPRDFHGRDLYAQARDAVDAIIESRHSGYLSFLLMTLVDDPGGAAEADRVAAALHEANWNCSAAPSSDCISFAIVALARHGSLTGVAEQRAFGELATYRNADGGYRAMAYDTTSNANSAAWALMAHRAAGRGIDPDTLRYLLDLQAPDGGFYFDAADRDSGNTGRTFLATADVLVALAGGHPLPAFRAPDLPETVSVGVPVELDLGDGYHGGTWAFPDDTLHGARVTRTFSHLGDHAFHLAALGDRQQYRGPATIEATNAAPSVSLPHALDGDRANPLRLAPAVTDPDGHAPTATYRLGPREGSLPADLDLSGLDAGEHDLTVTARDAWGGTTVATAKLTVRNLPPVIDAVTIPATAEAGKPFTVAVEARDPDGPAPGAWWRLGDDGPAKDGARTTWTLSEGHHALLVTLQDADGATATSSHTVRVVAPGAPPEPAPTIEGLTATVDRTHLHVDATVDPPGASLRLEWVVDGAPFVRDAVTLPRSEGLPPGAQVVESVRLTATTGGGEAIAGTGPVHVPQQPEADDAEADAEASPAQDDEADPDPASDAAPDLRPPSIERLRLRVDGGTLTVDARVQPEGARVDLTVTVDGTASVHRNVSLPYRLSVPGAGEVRVGLNATQGDLSATAGVGPVRLSQPAPPGPDAEATASVSTSTPALPLPLAFLSVAVLVALRRRP